MGFQTCLKKIYHALFNIRNKYVLSRTYKAEMRNIEKKKELYSRVHLTDEQEKEIICYWRELVGDEISTKWHRLYQSYMGIYNKDYFPEYIFSTKLEPLLSPAKYHGILSDKGFLPSIFQSEKFRLPMTYVWNCDGVFVNGEKQVIDEHEVCKKIRCAGKVVIKPTRDTSSGEGVRILDMQDGIDTKTGDDWETVLKQYDKNYLVQECIEQSHYLSRLYSHSLNTFRVITFITNDGVHVAPISMRIGRGGAEVDNIHAGGITIGINENNTLRKYAFSEMGERFDEHPDTKVVFDGYSIPPISNIVKEAIILHGNIPQIKMVSWDWTLDKDDLPVLIEVNISGQSIWFPQMLNGSSIFGEYTKYFAEMIKKKK